jgi:uncharacterized protein (TIGR02246 family)
MDDAIRKQVDAFTRAFNAGDGNAMGALYTEDAVLLPPGQERIEGRDGIAAFWQGAIGAGFKDLVLRPVEIAGSGDAAYEMGTVTLSAPAQGGGRQTVAGKYIVVWRRGADGAWRLHRDIWNFDAAG